MHWLLAAFFVCQLSATPVAYGRTLEAGSIAYDLAIDMPNPRIEKLLVDTTAQPAQIIGLGEDKRYYQISSLVQTIFIKALKDYTPPASYNPRDLLTDGRVALGKTDIDYAYLSNSNAVTLNRIEYARTLIMRLRGYDEIRYTLPAEFIFSTRTPQIINLGEDSFEEMLVGIKDNQNNAHIGILMPSPEGATLAALTPAYKDQMLTPIGVGDFNGNGLNEIAIVNAPSLSGYLEFYTMQQGQFRLLQRFYGFSNHFPNTPLENIMAIVDVDKNDVDDILISRNDLRAFAAVSYQNSVLNRIFQENLTARVASDLYVTTLPDGSPDQVAFLLDDGRLVLLTQVQLTR